MLPALALALLLAGCLKEERIGIGDAVRDAIVFQSVRQQAAASPSTDGPEAKGAPVEGGVMADGNVFAVSAFHYRGSPASIGYGYAGGRNPGDPSIDHMPVTVADGRFVYSPAQYWPGNDADRLQFFAYFPLRSAFDGTGGALDVGFTLDGSRPQMTMDYTLSGDPAEHRDLLWSATSPLDNQQVKLTFNHALTRVTLLARKGDRFDRFFPSGPAVKITAATIGSVLKGSAGRVQADPVSGPVWGLADGDNVYGDLALTGLLTREPLTSQHEPQFKYLVGSEGPRHALMMIPMSGTTSTREAFDKMTLKVTFTVGDGPEKTLSVPFGGVDPWAPGKHTEYLLTIQPDEIELIYTVQDWDRTEVDGDIDERELKVSSTEVVATSVYYPHVYFWTPDRYVGNVYLDTFMADGTTRIDDFYAHLTDADGKYFAYDPASGEGFFKLQLRADVAPGEYDHTLVLHADGLRRHIRVRATQFTPPSMWSHYSQSTWVGTFHRAGERGERIIYAQNGSATNPWSARVLTGGDFIELSDSPTLDPGVLTANPGDPEAYYVTDGKQEVSGTGMVYFRIGLKSTYQPTDEAPARYGKVEVTTMYSWGSTLKSIIYVRQGDAPDYVMRPTDPGDRAYAVKFSPYNLTARGMNDQAQSVDVAYRDGVFVEYPTQAGAFFQWGVKDLSMIRRAYHPAYPGAVTGWLGELNYLYGYWNTLGQSWETCPPGYRRPYEGSVVGPNNEGAVARSELRQSLWNDPVAGFSSNADFDQVWNANSQWGFYADGFFDRNPMQAQNAADPGTLTTVNRDSHRVGYVGRVYYNPHNDASLFMPSAGYREAADGRLNWPASAGNYWTATSQREVAVNGYKNAVVHQAGGWPGTYIVRMMQTFGMSVRCVRDDRPAEPEIRIYDIDDEETDALMFASYDNAGEGIEERSFRVTWSPATATPDLTVTAGEGTAYRIDWSASSPDVPSNGSVSTATPGQRIFTVKATTAGTSGQTLPSGTDYDKATKLTFSLAGAASKSITVTHHVLKAGHELEPASPSLYRFVGVFWRNDEVGERLIRMDGYTGRWSATVVQGMHWIMLDTGWSKDPAALTDNPGNAENYLVEAYRRHITGNGPVRFRMGIEKYGDIGEAYNRFGVVAVRLIDQGTTFLVYARQGQVAAPVVSWMSWAPFNVTSPAGGNTATLTAGSPDNFTARPSMAGYYFGQGTLGAATPADNVGSAVPPATAGEVCPAGYRKPTAAEMAAGLIGSGSATSVSLWGYYADGYFDRRMPRNVSVAGQGQSTTVGSGSTVAHIGRIFVNPQTGTSLFMPASGARANATGAPVYLGRRLDYWTGTLGSWMTSPATGGDPVVTDAPVYNSVSNSYKSVRCIKE